MNNKKDKINKFEQCFDNELLISFTTPTQKKIINDNAVYFPTLAKDVELSFFEVSNLLNLNNKVNYQGIFLTEQQKEKIIASIEEIIKKD